MRIGLLTTSFPRHKTDIAGHFVLGFAKALTARGHSVHVLAPEPADEALPTGGGDGIDLHWVPYLRPRGLQRTFYSAGVPDNLRRDPRAWLGLVPFVAALSATARRYSHNWDAVCSHWALPCGLIAAELARGRPHLAVVHSADLHLLRALPLRHRLATRLVRGSSAISCVSQRQRTELLNLLPPALRSMAAERIHVQPMGVDGLSACDTPREALRLRLGLSRFSVLSLSRLLPVKGLDVAIRACAALSDVELIIAGDGPERGALQALAVRLHAPVRFVGLCTGAQKVELLHAVDAFVCSSRRLRDGRTEGMPTALLEAQVAGLPTVASEVGGIGEWLRDSALLVPSDDAAALRDAIVRLRDAPQLRAQLATAARHVGHAHEWTRIAPRLEHWLAPRP